MKLPIGRVTYANGLIVATLNGVDDWAVTVGDKPDAGMARGLRAIYADTYAGPQDGHYGQRILRDLAERTGGEMEIRQFPSPEPGEIN